MGSLDGVAVPVVAVSVALLVIVSVVGLRRGRANRVTVPSTAAQRAELSKARRDAWRRGLSVAALGAGCLMLFAIAGTAGWLSFAAQRGYAHSRNGGDWDAATGFALLLDAGTLGLSLFRFFEALTLRSSALTRILLVAFVGASASMNYLHAPPSTGGVVDFGSRFVAVIPPLVYAVLLEMLLHKVEQVIMGKRPKRRKDKERGYSLILWVPFVGYPREMWRAWRADLHGTLRHVRAPGSLKPLPHASSDVAAVPIEPSAPGGAPALLKRDGPVRSAEESRPTPPAEAAIVPPPAVQAPVPAVSVSHSGDVIQEQPAPPSQPVETLGAPAARKPSLKQQLFEGLVQEMRSGIWDAVSDDPIARNAAWVRVNERLGQERGEEMLLAYNSARNAFRDLTSDLHSAAAVIRSELQEFSVHQRPSEGPPIGATLPELGEVQNEQSARVSV
ncbi:DUF2637 domain-containing protein [Streptomyces virginiae]|uniref:DUF2637 domain-containing protein n=1 Tax=Streptomyces virginiae TaxID=1961 RepID=UPI00224F0594|nr:DUF2637 domain-containing protein [Streptomyces virginiae]MCX5278096.1 DUF2637 domain-containing protein [Streptomyces virginiae]